MRSTDEMRDDVERDCNSIDGPSSRRCVSGRVVSSHGINFLSLAGNAVVREGEGTLDEGKWQNFALSWPEVVIGGGTPNIQKNIIAERILGLPKD